MKSKKKKEAEGAPGYMVQYTALMTILLAFFICLLTLGQQKATEYRKKGLGHVRDAFGLKGGLGLLPYWKAIMKNYPEVEELDEEIDEKKDLLGYVRGAFTADVLDAEEIVQAEFEDWGYSVRVLTPLQFETGSIVLSRDAQRFLDRTGGVFYNLAEHTIIACCYVSTGDPQKDYRLAAHRAVVITRYLKHECRVPGDRLRAVGYAHDRYLGPNDMGQSDQMTLFFVRKSVPSKKT